MTSIPTRALVAALAAAMAFAATGEPVSADRARGAVARWIASHPAAHMKARLGGAIRNVRTARADDADVFHVVNLESGGFVVASADDRMEPIVAFSDSGSLEENAESPLWQLLMADLPERLRAHRRGGVARRAAGRLRARRRDSIPTPAEEWRSLLANEKTTEETTELPNGGRSTVTDVRREPLVMTKWDQGDVGGSPCYNRYTPNNYLCGCVATAGAQLMYYHRHPTARVPTDGFQCWIDGASTVRKLLGGRYDWGNMPLAPSSAASLTAVQREALGRVCHDVGVASRMNWKSSGSGTCDAELAKAFVDVFGFANARCELDKSMSAEQIEDAIYANLDAKCPVILGLHNRAQRYGHEVIADGYGVYNGTIYTHLNCGWSGTDNVWYALPSVATSKYTFDALDSIVYNVFPAKTGELLTGRVLDGAGEPIAGATVTAENGSKKLTATTDGYGVYCLTVAGGKTWRVSTSRNGLTAAADVAVGVSRSTQYTYTKPNVYEIGAAGAVGNSWGNDLVLAAQLTGLVIEGDDSVAVGNSKAYACRATFSTGESAKVSPTWAISDNQDTFLFIPIRTYATLDAKSGVVTAKRAGRTVTLTATYTVGKVTKTATKRVAIVDAPGSAVIQGPSALATGQSETYRLVDAGKEVSATWKLTGHRDWFLFIPIRTYATVDKKTGRVTAKRAGRAVTLTATAKVGGTTLTATREIAIVSAAAKAAEVSARAPEIAAPDSAQTSSETVETLECASVPRERLVTSATWQQAVGTDRFTILCEVAGPKPKLYLQYWPEGRDELAETCAFKTCMPTIGRFVARAEAVVPGHEGETFRYRLLCEGKPVEREDAAGTVKLWGGEGDGDFTAVVWGDNQGGSKPGHWDADGFALAQGAFSHMMTRQPDFGIAVGDMAEQGRYEAEIKPLLLDCTNPILGHFIPYYVVWGNHDRIPVTGQIAQAYFALPEDPDYRHVVADNYFFYRGKTLFVFVDWFSSITLGGRAKARKWLEKVLSTDRAQKARFRIVVQHAPVHLETHVVHTTQEAFADLYSRYGVDAVLSGHMHGYEHIEHEGDSFVQLTNGGLGRLNAQSTCADYGLETKLGGHRDIPYLWRRQSEEDPTVLGPFEPVSSGQIYGYSELKVEGDLLTYAAHGFNADGSYIGIFDKFALKARQSGEAGVPVHVYPEIEGEWRVPVPAGVTIGNPVTKGDWQYFAVKVLGRQPVLMSESQSHEPATGMSRREAEAYVRWLNGGESGPCRLPTADELDAVLDETAPMAEWTSTDDETEGWCRIAGCAVRHIATPCCTASYLGFRVVKDED